MKDTKITRTISTAHTSITYVDLNTMQVGTVDDYTLITTQKVTAKDFEKYFESMHKDDGMKLLKVSEITYTSALYEMDLWTFMQYGTYLGEGRVNL